jgi:hypothetical protein
MSPPRVIAGLVQGALSGGAVEFSGGAREPERGNLVNWVSARTRPGLTLANHGVPRSACSQVAADERAVNPRKSHMMRTVAHLMPFAALAGGILILVRPPLLNYLVAVYLIVVGAIGLNQMYHFIR